MNKLTYSIVYTPENITVTDAVNYVCSDDKIHIRFKDFKEPQIIKGFEKKLTYLLTYLVNYSTISKLFDFCDNQTLINAFLKSDDLKILYNKIRYDKKINFKGFRLSVNYNKKQNVCPFGDLDENVFPLFYDNFGIRKTADLATFLTKLKVNLFEYLFNDSYYIVIHELKTDNVNNKFIKKEIRKNSRFENNDFAKLW